ncbi:hypothetical protein [Streptomyces sp. NBC_00118]|uniref:hypothetical protein n=1 Tax=unclassified Streptomyces TaxID=2593676 RepID=UPI00309380C9|nr:hypothetical protein OG518_22175 [Streptomyces sp. NBC_01397]
MSDLDPQFPEPGPTPDPTPAATVPAPVAGSAARRRPAVVVAVACAVVLAVGAGTGLTVMKVDAADRSAPTTVWAKPKEQKQAKPGRAKAQGLSARLLPVPEAYRPGPDIDEYGNDKTLTGGEAAARLKRGTRNLPSRQREAQDKAIDKLKLRGMAMRSYQLSGSIGFGMDDNQKSLVVEMQLAQMQNRRAGRQLKEFRSEFLRSVGVFPKGPKVKGHRNADCFLAPKDRKGKLAMVLCSAYEDDVLVTATGYGPRPLNTAEVADLLAQQLDRLTSQGGQLV